MRISDWSSDVCSSDLYTFAVTAGSLPAGLGLASDGTLSGTPTTSGTFTVTVTAADANSQTGSRAYALTIATATLNITPATLPAGSIGGAYAQSFSTIGRAPCRERV